MNKRGKIIIITGPSGAGKTSVAQGLLKNKSLNIQRVITCTTREMRNGEVNGRDYFFISKKDFLENIKKNRMFEYAEVYGNYYGSRKKDVEQILNSGKNVLFTVDIQGAIKLKRIAPSSIAIFIQAESIKELKKRLIGRNTDKDSVIKKRVDTALSEMKFAHSFDYLITNANGKVGKAIAETSEIIKFLNRRLILIEGLPGTGKSSVMEMLKKNNFIVFEFHTKRNKITRQYGAFLKNKRIPIGNPSIGSLENKLENMILSSRFLDPSMEKIKISLLKEKMNECLQLKANLVFKEGFLGCLIDKNRYEFLKQLKELLSKVDIIIFLRLSDKSLYERQMKRLGARKSEYDDTTSKIRHKIFMKQFRNITKNNKVIYLDAKPKPEIIAKNIEMLL